MNRGKASLWLVAALALAGAGYAYLATQQNVGALQGNSAMRPKLVLLTAGPDAFHQQVIVGAKKAAEDLNADLTIEIPQGSGSDQTAALVACSTESIDGLAISPLAPDEQAQHLSKLATTIKVVTYDNDVPTSLRHAYVGANNAMGGRLAATLVEKALPDGGKIAIFIGDNERLNAKVRRQSLINTLRGQRQTTDDDAAVDLEQPSDAGKYTVVGTFLDGSDPEQALANAKMVLKEHPDLQAMVALYGYDGPACLEALKEAGKEIPVIAFDEHDATLAGVEGGAVVGTVVQDPYLMGYKAIEELCRLCRNDVVALPLPGMGSYTLACTVVDKENLADFRDNVAKRVSEPAPTEKAK